MPPGEVMTDDHKVCPPKRSRMHVNKNLKKIVLELLKKFVIVILDGYGKLNSSL